MAFSILFPCSRSYRMDCAPYIIARGKITRDTPPMFRAFVSANKDAANRILFDSPGGDLRAGLALGRLVRSLRMDTFVGRVPQFQSVHSAEGSLLVLDYGTYGSSHNDRPRAIEMSGACFSACAYAFMGGVNRRIERDGRIGLHQFRRDLPRPTDLADAQRLTVLLANYLEEMGIDRRLLDVASSTGPDRIVVVPPDIALASNLDTSSPPKAPWRVSAADQGVPVLFAHQSTAPGRTTHVYIHRSEGIYYATVVLEFDGALADARGFPSREEFANEVGLEIDGRFFPLELFRGWERHVVKGEHVRFELIGCLSDQMVSALRGAKELKLTAFWPQSHITFWPNTALGVEGLSDGVALLSRSR